MRGRVGAFARAVAGAGDHGAVANQRGADRRFAASFRRPRLGEGEAHRVAVVFRAVRQAALHARRTFSAPKHVFVWRVRAFGLRTDPRSTQCGSVRQRI